MNARTNYPYFSTLLLIPILLSLGVLRATAEEIRIAVPAITNLLEEDQSGTYQRIFNSAVSETGYSVKQLFFPYQRALNVFQQGNVDCIFSFTDVMEERFGKESIISSFPLGAFGYFIFTAKNSPAITDVNSLITMRVGGVIGHENYYTSALHVKTKLFMVNSDEQNLQMLKLGRIQAFIAAIPDILPYTNDLNYSPEHALFTGYDRLTCFNNPENKRFVDTLSTQLKKLKSEGVYQQISGKLYVDFDESEP